MWTRNWNKGRCLLLGDASQPRKSLSRFLTTEHTEHTEINPPAVMLSFRVFGVFRGSLIFAGKSDYVVAAPQWNHFLSLPRIGSYSRSVKFVSSSPLVKSPTTIIKSSSIRK